MAENPDEMRLIHTGGLRADNEDGGIIDKMITLTYGRVIDGVPVIGKGSKIVVNIGENGAIEGLIRNWKAYSAKKELGPAEIKNQEELEKEFRLLVATQFGKDARAEVKRSYLVYFDNSGRFLQPVMAYESMITLPGGNVAGAVTGESKILPYLGVVEVMRNPPEKLNLTAIDPVGLRTINSNVSSPDKKPTSQDKSD